MTRNRIVIGAALLVAIAFGAGYLTGDFAATHPPILVGHGYVGDDVVSLTVGDTTYGFRGSVEWTDASGSIHDSDWPTCLPHLQEVTGIRFAVMKAFADDTGTEQIFWVDCRGH